MSVKKNTKSKTSSERWASFDLFGVRKPVHRTEISDGKRRRTGYGDSPKKSQKRASKKWWS